MRTKAVFELEMDDAYYQHILERIERDGEYTLPVDAGVVVRKFERVF